MTATLYANMPAAEYHADPAPEPSLSSGLAKVILAKSERAAFLSHPRLNPRARVGQSRFDIGTSAHAMLLEDDASNIVLVEADDWRTKEAKAARDEAHAAGKTALLASDFADVSEMVGVARAFVAQSEIADAWRDGASEQTVVWEEDGVWLRSRNDRLANAFDVITDYKTTESAAPEDFTRTIANLGYHISDAFYRRGIRALGHPDPKFIFLAQETTAPYDCALYGCDPLMREIGEAQVEAAINKWRACMKAGKWEGYGSRVMWASAPGWLQQQAAELPEFSGEGMGRR